MSHIPGFMPRWPWPKDIIGSVFSGDKIHTRRHTHVLAHAHTWTHSANALSSVWPSTSHLWRMNHFASNQLYHKTQWAHVLEHTAFTVIASETKLWGQWCKRANGSQITSSDQWNVIQQRKPVGYPADREALETSIFGSAEIDDEHENIFAAIL